MITERGAAMPRNETSVWITMPRGTVARVVMDDKGRHTYHVIHGDGSEWRGKPAATMQRALIDAIKKGQL